MRMEKASVLSFTKKRGASVLYSVFSSSNEFIQEGLPYAGVEKQEDFSWLGTDDISDNPESFRVRSGSWGSFGVVLHDPGEVPHGVIVYLAIKSLQFAKLVPEVLGASILIVAPARPI